MPGMLPLEIEETILDLLAEDDESHSALRTCSLVCHAFLPICRKHIFGSIVLNDYYVRSAPTTDQFDRLLLESPEIADYIRKLDFNIRITELTSPSIQKSLKRISRLEFLTIQPQSLSFDWRNNPIRPALLHLLHLPTLTHFKLASLNGFIVSDLIPCINLKYLDIGFYTTMVVKNTLPPALLEHSIQTNEFVAGVGTSGTIMKLCRARRPDGQSIIDFESLSKITVAIENTKEGEASQELFRLCHVLTNVHIFFWSPRYVRPSLADLLRPSMRTLKHIVVDIDVDLDVDPLFGISSELEDIRTKNVIETVAIGIRIEADVIYGRDHWSRLDKVLTTPGWFSLQRVSVAIEATTFSWSEEFDELKMAWQKLPETQFPRLSSSNSISFDFKITLVSHL